jgi:hypothetical protein
MIFSMQGTLQFSTKIVDGNSALADSVVVPTVLANGTTAGKANGYWSGELTIPAGDDETIDLLSLSKSVFGLSGTVSLASVKYLAIVNESPNVTITVEPGDSDGWDQLAGLVVGQGGTAAMFSGVAGLPIGGSSKTVKLTNDGAVTTLSGNTTNASPNVTGLSSTAGLEAGMAVSGAGIPAAAKIASITNGTSLVLTANATATATGVSLDFAWPDAVVRVYAAGVLD